MNRISDNSIFNSQISTLLGPKIVASVLPLGLPPDQLPDFIGALAANNPSALLKIPGITPQIIGAGVIGLKTAYLESFRYVWTAAGVLSATAVIGKSTNLRNPKSMRAEFFFSFYFPCKSEEGSEYAC